ncbi:GNAT family N-acetyltransferase [Chloroflexota bacterium]
MTFTLKSAAVEEKQVIFALLQPYLDELSRFPDEDPDYKDESGIYRYPYLDHYWREAERYPYIFYSASEIAGFALVRQDGEQWHIAEFYVLPQFRRLGLAMTCVTEIFRKHPGDWEIEFSKHNQAGCGLWHKMAEQYSRGDILLGESGTSREHVRFSV